MLANLSDTDVRELLAALDHAELMADRVEKGRIQDAEREFFDSDHHLVLVRSLNRQTPKHLDNTAYRYLSGLLRELAMIKANPQSVRPETIGDYCRDIRVQLTGDTGPCEPDKG